MLKDVTLLFVGAILSLGPAVTAMAAPLYFPSAPRWLWHYAFWLGISMFVIMCGDALLLLFFKQLRYGTLGLIALSAFFFAFAIVHQTAKSPKQDSNKQVTVSDDPNRPTLLDLYMTEFIGKFAGETIGFPKEMIFKDGHHERFYGYHYYDFVTNSNFMSFYIDTEGWDKIVQYISDNCKKVAAELPPMTYDAKIEGDDHIIRIEDTIFSGKIFIYVPAVFDVEKLADISKRSRENGCVIQMRGTEYENMMRNNIRHYKQVIPAHFKIINGVPQQVKPQLELHY